MQRCTRCYMPDTRPGSIFEDGVCQACRNYDKRKDVNWDERFNQLRLFVEPYRNKGLYDCVIPVSGGKDSHMLVHTCVKELNLNPLLITVNDSFTHTRAGLQNLNNLIEKFNLNHLQYTISHDLFKRATRIAFEETGEALKFVEYAIYTVPVMIAQKLGINLVFYGENSAYEYGSTKVNTFNANPTIKAMREKILNEKKWWIEKGLAPNEVDSILPPEDLNEIQVVFMSFFKPWSSLENLKVAHSYGFIDLSGEWKRHGTIEDFEQIDSIAYMIHLWLKYPKFGFQRVSDIASRRVREGKISLSYAKKLIHENDHKIDPRALSDFCNTCGYTKQEFWAIVRRFQNYK